jgi:hypothetical protein
MSAWDELRKADPQGLKRPLMMLQYALAPSRMSADVVRSDTILTPLTELSRNVEDGKHYTFKITLHVNSDMAEGIQVDLNGGSATVSHLRAAFEFNSNSFDVLDYTNALSDVASSDIFAGEGVVKISGGFTTSSDGTFIPRFAQKTHSSGTLTAWRESSMLVQEKA